MPKQFFFTLVSCLGLLGASFASSANEQADKSAGFNWKLIGPGTGGAMFSIAMHPTDPKTFYSGVDMGALFKTTDGGKSWKILGGTGPENPNPAPFGAFGIALDQQHPENVWSASFYAFKSEDGGKSWKISNTGDDVKNIYLEHIAVDPDNGNTVYAAGNHSYDKNGSVIRTFDGGKTWQPLVLKWPDGEKHLTGIVIDPFSRFAPGKGHERVYVFGKEGIYRSEDHGETWKKIKGNLPGGIVNNVVFLPNPEKGKNALLFANCLPRWTNKEKKEWDGGVYCSYDDGKTWSRKTDSLQKAVREYSSLFERFGRFHLCASKTGALYYAFGFSKVYKSTDKGETWTSICDSKSVWEKTRNPQFNTTEYWFLPLKEDNACQFKHHSSQGAILGLAVSPADENTVLFTHNSYIAGTFDGGKSWEELGCELGEEFAPERWGRRDYYAPSDHSCKIKNRGLHLIVPKQLAFDPYAPDKNIAAAYMDLGLRISRDGGEYWEWAYDKNSMIRADSGSANSVVFDPLKKGCIYLGTGTWNNGDLFRSGDGGKTFERLHISEAWDKNKELDKNGVKAGKIVLSRIRLDPASPAENRTIYTGVSVRGGDAGKQNAGGIYKSVDNGKSWKSMNNGLPPGMQINELLIVNENPSVLYTGTNHGLFKTENGAGTWKQLLPEKMGLINENCLAICQGKPEILYAVAKAPDKSAFWDNSTLFRSDDAGKTWKKLRDGFISSVAVSPFNPDWVYITIPAGYNPSYKERGGVMRSKDGGKSWDFIDGGKIVEGASRGRIEVDICNPRRLIYYALYGVWIGNDSEAPIKKK